MKKKTLLDSQSSSVSSSSNNESNKNQKVKSFNSVSYNDLARTITGQEFPTKTMDGLVNVISNLQTGRDKNAYNDYNLNTMKAEETLSSMYRTSWIAAKIVDIPPYEMTREWRTFTCQDPEGQIKKELENAEKKFNVKNRFREALIYSRIFGGAAIVMNIEGSGNIDEPLFIENIKKGGLKQLSVLDRRLIFPVQMGDEFNPGSPDFADPAFYNIVNYRTRESSTFKIHKSRIIKFDGISLPMFEYLRNMFWGDSVLNRVMTAVSNCDLVQQAIASMTHETNVDIFRIKDLSLTLGLEDGANQISNRLLNNNLIKSLNNSIVIDKDHEDFERKPLSFQALPEVLKQYLSICASASDIPATRLLGSSPDGLNATGDSDIRNFYDSIRSGQEDVLREKLGYFDQVLAMSTFGHLPEDLKFEFNPLWQTSDKEVADINYIKAQTYSIYLRDGILQPETVLQELMIDETYSSITQEMVDELSLKEPEEDFYLPEEPPKNLEGDFREVGALANEKEQTTY